MLRIFACLVLVMSAIGVGAQPAAWPNKPVRIVVPTTAGDGSDVLARTLAKALSESTGQAFVVENKPGAGGSIGADLVAKASADGYTVFLGNGTSHGATPSLYPNLPYDSVADFTPVVMISTAPNVLAVSTQVPANTVAEFLALARKSPGELTLASGGNGSISHLSIELLKAMAGIDVLHVPYKGAAPALVDIASGRVTGMIINIPSVLPMLQNGKLKALAVTSLKPAATLPDVPTLDAAGVPGYQTLAWFGFMLPSKTSPEVVDALYQKTKAALQQPDVQATLARLGADPSGMGPADFKAHVKSEIAKYAKVIKDANIKVQ
ncbi:MAG: tripartite tricarboxylate transporter substrate binding protein [Variovorax sp.]